MPAEDANLDEVAADMCTRHALEDLDAVSPHFVLVPKLHQLSSRNKAKGSSPLRFLTCTIEMCTRHALEDLDAVRPIPSNRVASFVQQS